MHPAYANSALWSSTPCAPCRTWLVLLPPLTKGRILSSGMLPVRYSPMRQALTLCAGQTAPLPSDIWIWSCTVRELAPAGPVLFWASLPPVRKSESSLNWMTTEPFMQGLCAATRQCTTVPFPRAKNRIFSGCNGQGDYLSGQARHTHSSCGQRLPSAEHRVGSLAAEIRVRTKGLPRRAVSSSYACSRASR